jgi:hypothetical protein
MIAETLDLVVHLHLDQRSADRRVVQVAEVAGLEAGRVLANDLFRLEPEGLIRTGIRARFADRLPELAPAAPSAWAGVGAG